jgi:hypothetical protein
MRIAWLALAAACTAEAAPLQNGPVVTIEGDLDNIAGVERIALYADGLLEAGTARVKVENDREEGQTSETQLDIVSLGAKHKGILVTPPDGGDEAASRHRVFWYTKGTLVLVLDETTYDRKLAFSRDGSLRIFEDAWGACAREMKATRDPELKRAKVQVSTFKLDVKKRRMLATQTTSNKTVRCDQLSACPFVYEVRDGEPHFVGEILRNVRYEPAQQSLWLGPGAATEIRLTEEKREITFLDEIYLDVDGVAVKPAACIADPKLDYCAADGVYHVLKQGDALPLSFAAKPGKRKLVARGFYNPL